MPSTGDAPHKLSFFLFFITHFWPELTCLVHSMTCNVKTTTNLVQLMYSLFTKQKVYSPLTCTLLPCLVLALYFFNCDLPPPSWCYLLLTCILTVNKLSNILGFSENVPFSFLLLPHETWDFPKDTEKTMFRKVDHSYIPDKPSSKVSWSTILWLPTASVRISLLHSEIFG